ncbi:unnamed protein product [Rotaria sordida]|uniref:tRNA synthetases class I catalytic domain-containing protein n=1 Tax=Rotaria sordida TaxID=392033 RepID=A0A814EG94_9BILA|nr:unnamed protein product [Rotaria sordida]
MGHIIALSVQERALTTSEIANKDKEKHNKSGEPVCLSPRNFRQPRYHIQRGVMASNFSDSKLDILTNAIDQKLPHHTNKIALSETYHDNNLYANYFVHIRCFNYDRFKMIKLLKNVVIIIDAFTDYQLKLSYLLFLLGSWSST